MHNKNTHSALNSKIHDSVHELLDNDFDVHFIVQGLAAHATMLGLQTAPNSEVPIRDILGTIASELHKSILNDDVEQTESKEAELEHLIHPTLQ